MFLNVLTLPERQAFLELAYVIAYADGDLADPEAKMLGSYRVELDLPESEYEIQWMELEDAAAVFESDLSRRAALMELMLVVMADGVAHPQEHELLATIQAAMGIDEEVADRQFAWVQRLAALVSVGKRMIELGEAAPV